MSSIFIIFGSLLIASISKPPFLPIFRAIFFASSKFISVIGVMVFSFPIVPEQLDKKRNIVIKYVDFFFFISLIYNHQYRTSQNNELPNGLRLSRLAGCAEIGSDSLYF